MSVYRFDRQRRRGRVAGAFWLCCASAVALLPAALRADGTLRTGGTDPVVTLSEMLGRGLGPDDWVQFTVEFATEESAGPGAFLDSGTITVARGTDMATLLTLDGFGARWAPPSPAGWPVAAGALGWGPGRFEAPVEFIAAGRWSFDVVFLLPPEWTGGEIRFFADLFDNLDPRRSLLSIRDLQLVPEPGTTAMVLSGALVLGAAHAWRRRR